ncbi:hypothetical protein [Methylococcus sp. EFPC2]|uniref:hypothetical protein n=1 Tax=Methylococcus sp. EFPC2 TaxID=2812648 RepID=UPI0019680705|nr:hypothetical protein [Methylococcus sp. EFPC2]QSA97072.1 hypothetical protein JWZ97_18040 [Methylococcus sp. EFPC2]
MATTFTPSVSSAISSALSRRGIDLLSGIFRGGDEKEIGRIADLILAQTGIQISDAADDKLSDEQWVKLKEFELQNQEDLLPVRQKGEEQNLELEAQKLANQDRKNARDLQIAAMNSSDPWIRRFIHGFAVLITLLTFAFVFKAAFSSEPIDPERLRIIDTVIGFLLGTSLSAIIQFFYGSSYSSSNKQDQIERLTQRINQQPRREGE